MATGKSVRLARLFSHPKQRYCSVAVDHFIAYQSGVPEGIRDLADVVRKLVSGGPDSITMQKGAAICLWEIYAGKVPLIINACTFDVQPTDAILETFVHPEESLRLGADACAMSVGLRGPNELARMKMLADASEEADRAGIPIVAHLYPRDFSSGTPQISFTPEDVYWAVRCGWELGADVLKVPYTGDVASYRDIISTCPIPIVASGGPKTPTLRDALVMMQEVIEAGARGATVGRNIWGTPDPTKAVLAFKAVVHDDKSPDEAMKLVGFSG